MAVPGALGPQGRVLGAVVLTFAALLLGRKRFGWRGRSAVRMLYTGAALLLLAYVGSRFALEGGAGTQRMKYLLVLAVIAIGYAGAVSAMGAPPSQGKRPPLPAPQDMVACDCCGVHLPRSEALTHGACTYCCAEHQQQDAR